MPEGSAQKLWENYCQQELNVLRPILMRLGFELEEQQIHLGGERYISVAKKLVLLGRRLSDGQRVVIKASNEQRGINEIKREIRGRQILEKINFAYHVFLSPAEILFRRESGYIIFITDFIEQSCPFLERSLVEQFFLALKGLEAQEGAQATTYEHTRTIGRFFKLWQAKDYQKKFAGYLADLDVILSANSKIKELLARAGGLLTSRAEIIDLYSGWLVHWDFVPHNFRVNGHDLYLLDHSSLRFGNKYESWARFINFMTLYNPNLEQALLDYVVKNRSREEVLSLQLMCTFRLGELIWHYASSLDKVDDNLRQLNKARIDFWAEVLAAVLDKKVLDPQIIEAYKKVRDSLRTPEEKQRQKGLH
jgi:hypothetical protein